MKGFRLHSQKRKLERLENHIGQVNNLCKNIIENLEENKIKMNSILEEIKSDYLSIQEFAQKYGINFPLKTKEDFKNLDATISDNETVKIDF